LIEKLVHFETLETHYAGLQLMNSLIVIKDSDEHIKEQLMKFSTNIALNEDVRILELLVEFYDKLCEVFISPHLFEKIVLLFIDLIRSRFSINKDELLSLSSIDFGFQTLQQTPTFKSDVKIIELRLRILRNIFSKFKYNVIFHEIIEEIWTIMIYSTMNENRYIREIGYMGIHDVIQVDDENLLNLWSSHIVNILDMGLMDHWSEVRLAASVATVTFLTIREKHYSEEKYLKRLLPKIALNRHHPADRIKSYSLNAWKEILGPQGGKYILTSNISETLDYYLKQLDADSASVREASCYSVAELIMKLDREIMNQRVLDIIQKYMITIRDDSWAVREASCFGIGECISRFPSEMDQLYENDIFDLLLAHLSDNATSVRETSAIALSKGIIAYPGLGLSRVKGVLNEFLLLARQQAYESNYSNKEGDTRFYTSDKRR
jgi:hypothetical protein